MFHHLGEEELLLCFIKNVKCGRSALNTEKTMYNGGGDDDDNNNSNSAVAAVLFTKVVE